MVVLPAEKRKVMLTDRFHRVHDYLRISLTDNCNFRCSYCMPEEQITLLPKAQLMQADEIFAIARTFADLGVKKIRLTGGEPMARKDFADILAGLSRLPVKLAMTTNGVMLDQYMANLQQAGLTSINISLDSLLPDKFRKITRRDAFARVWSNILGCIAAGMHVKLNVVMMKGVNDDEIAAFTELTRKLPVHVRFIEFMPFDQNRWDRGKVIGSAEVMEVVAQQYALYKLKDGKNDTDRKFGIMGHAGTLCFISTLTDSFCATCNRLRLTADGKMKNCLFGAEEFDVLAAFRSGADIAPVIRKAISRKHERLGGQFNDYRELQPGQLDNRSMIRIGG